MQKIIRDVIAQNFKDEKPHFQIHKGITIRFGLASWAIIKQYLKKKKKVRTKNILFLKVFF